MNTDETLLAMINAAREREREQERQAERSSLRVFQAMARAQLAQARRLGYRDAATRYDGKGN